MTINDKYCVNNKFTNYSLESFLKDLGLNETLINQIIIRTSVSGLTKELIKRLQNTEETQEELLNVIFEYFLLADTMKPITCNKKTLSILTGLSERQIDERRRSRELPFIQLSGGSGIGKKVIVYDPVEIMDSFKSKRVKAL